MLTVFFGPLVIIYGLYRIPYINDFLVPPWKAGEILGYMGAFYALIGTSIFSILALKMNYLQREDNKKAQEESLRLQIYPFLTYSIDETNHNASIRILSLDCEKRAESGTIEKKEECEFYIAVKNIGLKSAIDFTILDTEFVCKHDKTSYKVSRIEVNDTIIIEVQALINIASRISEHYSNVPIKFKIAYTDIVGHYYEQFFTATCNWVTTHNTDGTITYGPFIATIDKNNITYPVYYANKSIQSEEIKKIKEFEGH